MASPKNANVLLKKEIDNFMCANTNKLFKQFLINKSFLNVMPLNLDSNKYFQKSRLI